MPHFPEAGKPSQIILKKDSVFTLYIIYLPLPYILYIYLIYYIFTLYIIYLLYILYIYLIYVAALPSYSTIMTTVVVDCVRMQRLNTCPISAVQLTVAADATVATDEVPVTKFYMKSTSILNQPIRS